MTSYQKMQLWKKELNHKLNNTVDIMYNKIVLQPEIKLYLWYRLPEVWESEVCELLISEDRPKDCYLVCPKPYDIWKDKRQNWNMFYESIQNKPILNPND